MGILEIDFERILGVTFFISSSQFIMLWVGIGLTEIETILAHLLQRT